MERLISNPSAQVGDWMGRLGWLLDSEIDGVYMANGGDRPRDTLQNKRRSEKCGGAYIIVRYGHAISLKAPTESYIGPFSQV